MVAWKEALRAERRQIRLQCVMDSSFHNRRRASVAVLDRGVLWDSPE
jgi:hypothetical protein